MDALYDPETSWPVDVRTLSSHRGYVMSSLAPVTLQSGAPMAAVYGTTLFDAAKFIALIEDLARGILARRGRFDLKRFAAPMRGSEKWRSARSIADLIGDDDFADHAYDRLAEYGRVRSREVQAVDLLGQPSVALTQTTFAILEELEATTPMWARMQLESWPTPRRVPTGYELDETFPPKDGNDVFVYCYRVYDVDHAVDVLAEHFVRAFADEIIRRALANGITLDDLLENGRPTLFMTAAAAEALARGIMNLRDVITFLKRRVAQKRAKFVEQSLALDTSIEPGVLLEIRKHFCEIAQTEHDFSGEELAEIALQWKIHRSNPRRIAQILYGLSLVRPRSAVREDPSIVKYGPLSIPKRDLGR